MNKRFAMLGGVDGSGHVNQFVLDASTGVSVFGTVVDWIMGNGQYQGGATLTTCGTVVDWIM